MNEITLSYYRTGEIVTPREAGKPSGLAGIVEVGRMLFYGLERQPVRFPGGQVDVRAIPSGRHRVELVTMSELGVRAFRLVDWPESDAPAERDHFAFHVGSYPENFKGCLGAGSVKIPGGIGNTRATCERIVTWAQSQGAARFVLRVVGDAVVAEGGR